MANKNGILYDVFISYSNENLEKADKLSSRISSQGINVWFQPSNISGGDVFLEEIEKGLQRSQTVVVLLSNSSVNSFWVRKEWRARLVQMSHDRKKKLIPVLIEDCQIPELLSDHSHIDFRNIDFHDTSKFEEKVQELCDSIKSVLPPPGSKVIGIPIAVIAMTREEAEELISKSIFKVSTASTDQRNRFERFFKSLKEQKLDNFIERYGETREEYRPFKSDNISIREILEKMTGSANEMHLVGSDIIVRPHYYSNEFFSDQENIRGQTWDYLEHNGCILILDGISMFHPKIQSAFLTSHLGVNEHTSLVCISPLNPGDSNINKMLEKEINEKFQRVFDRYTVGLDPQCSLEIGNERTLNRWLIDVLPRTVDIVQKQKANPEMRRILRQRLGQPAGQAQLIFS